MLIKEVRALAESGDLFYQFLMGFLHEYGVGVQRSNNEAKKRYEKAAEQGFAPAQYAISVLINEQGEKVGERHEAFRWCERAASDGYAPAQHLLGMYYENGGMTEPNLETARHWTGMSAEQGYLPAIAYMATIYEEGIGVRPDKSLARKYRQEAAEKGDGESAFLLASKLLEEETEESIAEGLKWAKIAAKTGDVNANGLLGQIYGFGLYGCNKDPKLAEVFQARGFLKLED